MQPLRKVVKLAIKIQYFRDHLSVKLLGRKSRQIYLRVTLTFLSVRVEFDLVGGGGAFEMQQFNLEKFLISYYVQINSLNWLHINQMFCMSRRPLSGNHSTVIFCAYIHAAPGSNPKYTIYDFLIYIGEIETVIVLGMRKRTKINKIVAGMGPYFYKKKL